MAFNQAIGCIKTYHHKQQAQKQNIKRADQQIEQDKPEQPVFLPCAE